MNWNEEEHRQSTDEVDRFLYGPIDELIDNFQETQWIKYDESCMHVKYSLFIKTIYDLILQEGWTTEMIKSDFDHHLENAKSILNNKDKEKPEPISDEEYIQKLENIIKENS
jgi:hypothetical protein